MAKIGTLASSLLIHGIGVGVVLWAGLLIAEPEAPTVSLSAPRAVPATVQLERPVERPQPDFKTPEKPEPALEVEPVPVEIERETVDEIAEAENALPFVAAAYRPAPRPGRPIAFTPVRIPEPEAAPAVAQATTETKPVEIHNPPPRYPRLAQKRGLEGEVVVEVIVLPDGSCGEAKVVEHAGVSSFADAALAALRKWKFLPAMRDGNPIAFTQRVRFVFRLRG